MLMLRTLRSLTAAGTKSLPRRLSKKLTDAVGRSRWPAEET